MESHHVSWVNQLFFYGHGFNTSFFLCLPDFKPWLNHDASSPKKMLFHGLDVPSPSPSRCVVNSFIRPEAEAASAAKSGACSRLSFLETKRRLSKGKNLGKTGKTLGTTWEKLEKTGKTMGKTWKTGKWKEPN